MSLDRNFRSFRKGSVVLLYRSMRAIDIRDRLWALADTALADSICVPIPKSGLASLREFIGQAANDGLKP